MDTIKRLARVQDALNRQTEPQRLDFGQASGVLDEALALLSRPFAELSAAERSCRRGVLAWPALSPNAPPRSMPVRDLSRWTRDQLVTYRAKLVKVIDLARSVR